MSIWTHVIGGIRLDGFAFEQTDENKLKKVFIQSTFENWNKKCNMPCGSEGSIRYKIIENEDKNCLNKCQIALWGDLRDYGSDRIKKEFKIWLKSVKNKLKKEGFLIRQLFLTAECEDGLIFTYRLNEYDGELIEQEEKNEIKVD